MKHKEEPFESLARGLDKDLSPLFGSASLTGSRRNLLTPLVPVFGCTGMAGTIPASPHEALQRPPFESLSDRFAQQIAVFPLVNHVVINQFGAFIPKSVLSRQSNLDYRDSQYRVAIRISIHPDEYETETSATPYQARPWMTIAKDDPIYDIGRDPVTLDITDASENLDKYIYGGE